MLVTALAGCGGGETETVTTEAAVVARVGDGDTFDVRSGERVRLVQVDAPELGEGECYAREAKRALEALILREDRVSLEADAALDDRDRYGRLLRYAFAGTRHVNVELVRIGAAAPYFRRGEEGRYAQDLLAAVEEARSAGRGMWAACQVAWSPDKPVTTRPR